MNPQEQVGKLQSLLARIQRNAALPRAAAPFSAPGDVAQPEAAPIPLVSRAAPPAPAPPALDDEFAVDEVSEVRFTTAQRTPGPEVTVAAIEAEAEPLGSEELSDEDLVEVTEGTPPPEATEVDIDFDDEDEEPPASSSRSKVASSMDEALAAAAERLEAEREVPLKTPPPESGPQEAALPADALVGTTGDSNALQGGELEIPTRSDTHLAAATVPTAEQLGQTIDLEEARGPSLELAEHQVVEAQPAVAVEELEVTLPARDVVGGYDEGLLPPPEALSDLEAHRRSLEDEIAPPPESLAQFPSVQPLGPGAEVVPLPATQAFGPSTEIVEVPAAYPTPELIARPVAIGGPETFSSLRENFRPSSFVELLDASLALRGE